MNPFPFYFFNWNQCSLQNYPLFYLFFFPKILWQTILKHHQIPNFPVFTCCFHSPSPNSRAFFPLQNGDKRDHHSAVSKKNNQQALSYFLAKTSDSVNHHGLGGSSSFVENVGQQKYNTSFPFVW